MRKQLAIAGLSAGLVAGGAAGFAFTGSSVIAGAQTESTTTVAPSDTADQPDGRPNIEERLTEALTPLLDDGTLTQDQLDAVVATLKEAAPERGERGGKGHRGERGRKFADGAIADTLGMTQDELREALQAGSTVAEIAEEKGIELSTIVDAAMADANEKSAERVADGDVTQAEADERLAQLEERITAHLNGELPERGERPHRGADGAEDTDSGN